MSFRETNTIIHWIEIMLSSFWTIETWTLGTSSRLIINWTTSRNISKMWNLIDFKTSPMPSRDIFPTNLAEVDYSPSFGLASLEKCAWSNVLIGNIYCPLMARGGGGGGFATTKFYTGRLHPDVQPLTLLCIFSDERGPPFLITSVESFNPFHKPSLQLCTPLSYNLQMHCL